VYLLRRVANQPLAAVARRAGISPARVSQIQTEIEREGLRGPLKVLADNYKLKA
jgi:DNA-binding Lrp family transcriptional regulator